MPYLPKKKQKETEKQALGALLDSVSQEFFAPMPFMVGVKRTTQIIPHYVQSNGKS